MKRVKAACILQTLVFAQKDDCGLTHEQQLKVNHDEVSHYKAMMDRSRTRYQITEETRLTSIRRVCDRKRGYKFLLCFYR